MCVCEVAQSCPTHHDPMDCSPPCSSIHGIFQARVLELGAIAFSSKHLWTLVNSKKLYVNLYFVGVIHSWCFLSAFGCILSPYLFNLYADYIMRNAGLDEAKLESRFLREISITSDMQIEKDPTPVLFPGKSHGWRSMVGCSPQGCKESETTECLCPVALGICL